MQSERLTESPLNYTGGKYKLLTQILPLFPDTCNEFIDLFSGGCNVGINVSAKKIRFNDCNSNLQNIFKVFYKRGKDSILRSIKQIIRKYGLSDVSANGYEYYGCNGGEGLAEYNRERYIKLRSDMNARKNHDDYYYIMLYVIIVYAFNNQIRFNRKGEFNLPVGKRDFNSNMKQKLCDFIDRLQTIKCTFTDNDFKTVRKRWSKDDFVYADPPYLITTAGYNEDDGWTEEDEIDLLAYLDRLNAYGVRFALSNVLESKGRRNTILDEWCKRNRYFVHHLAYSYSNSNYHRKNKDTKSDEVLITNY